MTDNKTTGTTVPAAPVESKRYRYKVSGITTTDATILLVLWLPRLLSNIAYNLRMG